VSALLFAGVDTLVSLLVRMVDPRLRAEAAGNEVVGVA
jgi:hypothetical protein